MCNIRCSVLILSPLASLPLTNTLPHPHHRSPHHSAAVQPPGRKMNEAGSVAHSTEARTREEGKKARPVAQTCTVKGCSKWRISGCNGMCIAHNTEAGNPVPVTQTCTVKGCSKLRQSGCNGMCIAHSREAGDPVPHSVAKICTVKGEHTKIKKSCRADECLTQSNGGGGATRGTVRSPNGTGDAASARSVCYCMRFRESDFRSNLFLS